MGNVSKLCINIDPGEGELMDDDELRSIDGTPLILRYLLNVQTRLRALETRALLVVDQEVGEDHACTVSCRAYQGSFQLNVEGIIPPEQLRPLGKSLHDSLSVAWDSVRQ